MSFAETDVDVRLNILFLKKGDNRKQDNNQYSIMFWAKFYEAIIIMKLATVSTMERFVPKGRAAENCIFLYGNYLEIKVYKYLYDMRHLHVRKAKHEVKLNVLVFFSLHLILFYIAFGIVKIVYCIFSSKIKTLIGVFFGIYF